MTRLLFTVVVLVAGILPAPGASATAAEPPRTDRHGDPLPKGAIARLGTLRMRGCRGPVVFSPDGKYVVAGGGEGGAQIIFWDIATGRRVKTLTTAGYVTRLAFSPDSKQLAALSYGDHLPDKLVSVWNVATGKQRFCFPGQSYTGGDIAFSADGKALVAIFGVLNKTTVLGYDTTDGKRNFAWSFDHPRPEDFILSLDGQFAAAPDDHKNAKLSVFELRKKVKAKTLTVELGDIKGCRFSRDGRRLVAGGDRGWILWDWKSGQALRKGCGHDTPTFSPDGRRLAWSSDASLWVLDWDGGQPSRLGARNWFDKVRFSDDGKKLAAGTAGGALVLVDSRTGRDLLPLDAHTDIVLSLAYFAGGRYLATREPFRLLVWEAATGKLLRRFPDDLPTGETALLKTASHGRIVTAELPDGILRLRDLVTGKELRRLQGKHGYVDTAPWDRSAVSSDGTLAAIRGPGEVRVHDLTTGEIRCRFAIAATNCDLNFSEDGRILMVEIYTQEGWRTSFHDSRTGRQVEASAEQNRRKDPDGRWRLSPAEAKARLRKLRLLDDDGRSTFVDSVASVFESPDSRYVIVSGLTQRRDNSGVPSPYNSKSFLRLWDTATRRLITEWDDKHGAPQIVGFSSDGRTLICQTSLRESSTGRERLRLVGHSPGVVTVAIRPDGRVLVRGGYDAQVLLWDVTGRMPDGVWRETHHSPEQLAELWQTLAGEDASRAYRAMWSLEAAPEQTLSLLRERLRPMGAPEPRRLARLLAALDSDEFAEREKATRELEQLGELSKPALRRLLKERPTLEQRRRCEQLLEKPSVLSSERLRAIRAVEVLERLGTPEACKLLEEWRQGVPEARLTQEARTALDRLAAARKLLSEFQR
jgi:WD40 repeat protein